MKLLVLFSDTIFEIAYCLSRWSWISKHLFFWYVFWLWVSKFSVSGEHFQQRAVKNEMFVSRRFFWKMTNFEKQFFGFWVWSRKFLTFGIKLLHGFKKWNSSDHRIFRGKECINENLNTWFFPEFERKTAPSSVNFFWRSVKRQSMTAEELLEEKVKNEISFDSLCHKFLAWVSFLLSTCPREPFEEENVSINYFPPTCFRGGNFSDFWGSFFGKAAN